jgi:hypothetical protein
LTLAALSSASFSRISDLKINLVQNGYIL